MDMREVWDVKDGYRGDQIPSHTPSPMASYTSHTPLSHIPHYPIHLLLHPIILLLQSMLFYTVHMST